jgi:hypothetical protein
VANKLHNLRMAERYSTAIFSTPDQAGLAVRPFQAFRLPLDTKNCVFRCPDREVPVVVHAPSNRGVKQTDLILETLERLRAEGVAFELRLLSGVSNAQVLEALTDADVLIDEMSLYPATISHEGMASGCAVATGNLKGANPLPANAPILHIQPSNLYAQLRRLLTDRDLRRQLARDGLSYVESHNTPQAVGNYIVQAVERSQNGLCDYFPEFFYTDYRVPAGDVVPGYLREMTVDILRTYGAPPEVDLERLRTENLVPPAADLTEIPRWNTPCRQTAPWVRVRADAFV